jgi:hypothetical protein
MRQQREQSRENAEPRRERIPVGVPRLKLDGGQRQGFVRRWVNDDGNRLQDFQAGGYEFVMNQLPAGSDITARESTDSRVSRVVGTKADGSPLTAYLMEIRRDWYEEDQAAKQKRLDDQESQMRRGEDSQGGAPGRDGRYVPRDGITIDSVLK